MAMDPSGAKRVEHVVVLMLENRSFDNLLGYLDHPAGPDFDGLVGREAFNVGRDGVAVAASADGVPYGVDPDHSHAGALEQMGKHGGVAANGGFVVNYERMTGSGGTVMQCLDPDEHCPAIATLAREFAVCTRWFSSVPGETWPNRNFAHAGTSDGTVDIEIGFYYDPTIFDLLTKVGASWRIYFDGPPQLWCFRRLWRHRTVMDFVLRRSPRIGNWFEFPSFAKHVRAGDLPTYSFIEPAHNQVHSPPGRPRQTNSQHPHNNLLDAGDFQAGERLIAEIYETLRDNPELFERTVLVVVYDEHGGLYDHVVPPGTVPPGDRIGRRLSRWVGRILRWLADRRQHRPGTRCYDFSQLGVRVPAVIVSPWINRATMITDTLEHASIPATLRQLFAPERRPLTKRDAQAATFHQWITKSPRSAPRRSSADPDHPGEDDLPDLSGIVGRTGMAVPEPRAVVAAGSESGERQADGGNEDDRDFADLTKRVDRRLKVRSTLSPSRWTRDGQPRRSRPRAAPDTDATAVERFADAADRARRRA